MKKKVIGIVAVALVLVMAISILVACNNFKWDSIGAADVNATVESNGGYFVQQGKYAFFINGYVGSVTENEFGTVTKQGIVRAEIKDGAVDMSTAKLLAPINVYNESKVGGLAIFGEWIYYASPNLDKNKNGTASTTDTNFMRTKTDGTITQVIGKISTRSAEYFFTSSRVIYYVDNTISYVDFSGMKTNKSLTEAKGAEYGTIASNVSSFTWDYNSKYFFFTQTITGDDSYKNYNNLYVGTPDGATSLLATEKTYLAANEDPITNAQKVFKFTLADMYVDSASQVTIYYTKSYYIGEDKTVGLFMNKFSGSFDIANEKILNTNASTTLYPLGYDNGAIAYDSNSCYCLYKGQAESDPVKNYLNPLKVTDASKTIWYIDADGYAYYTASSDPENLYKVYYKEATENAYEVLTACMTIDKYGVEFVGDNVYFFDGDDDNYIHAINYKTFDNTDEDAETLDLAYPVREKTEDEE